MRGTLLACLLALAPGLSPAQSASVPRPARADVDFVSGMIHHHRQALTMVALIQDRSARADLRLLGERIDVSQRDEIALLMRWLDKRRVARPHLDHHPMMPGMLTEAELDTLRNATGSRFDRLFLTGMIRHHEGALTMVAQLIASADGGKEPELFSFATGVDADQRAEIRRMRDLLATLPPETP